MSESDSPLNWQLRQEMQRIAQTARAAYKAGQYAQAGELYGRAKQIADRLNDPWCVEYGDMQGNCLNRTGHTRLAIAVLAPLVRAPHPDAKPSIILSVLVEFIDCALALPCRLAELVGAIDHARRFIQGANQYERLCKLKYMESALLSDRGLWEPALRVSEEALRLRLTSTAGAQYYVDAHFSQAVSHALDCRDRQRTEELLNEWEQQTVHESPEFTVNLALYRSALACLCHLPSAAWNFLQAVIPTARQSDIGTQKWCIRETVRVRLALGQLTAIPTSLAEIANSDESERGYERFQYRLLVADYHLALARDAAGMPPVDDSYALEFPLPERVVDAAATLKHLADAREAYARADEVGRWIDGQLECSWRTEQIAERLRRVAAIEDVARR